MMIYDNDGQVYTEHDFITAMNKVGRRLLVEDRKAIIIELFTDKHFIVEFDDDHTRKEIHVKMIMIGSDAIK